MATYFYDLWIKVDVAGWSVTTDLNLVADRMNKLLSYDDPFDGKTEIRNVSVTGWQPNDPFPWLGIRGKLHAVQGSGEGRPPTETLADHGMGWGEWIGGLRWSDGVTSQQQFFTQTIVEFAVNPSDTQFAGFGILKNGYYAGPDITYPTITLLGGTPFFQTYTFTFPDHYWKKERGSIEAGFTEFADRFPGDGTAKFPDFLDIFDPDLSNWGLEALGGDDVVKLGKLPDSIDGGAGVDQLHGEGGNDELEGGTGNDPLFGGIGRDTAVFVDGRANSYAAFLSAKRAENKNDDSKVVIAAGGEGIDTLDGMELARFNGVDHAIPKIYITIARNNDGTATGTLTVSTDTGPKQMFDALLGGNMIAYDTLTPIETGEYAAYFRLRDGAPRQVLELEDWDGNTQGRMEQGSTFRTNIQIHGGSDVGGNVRLQNGSSEGCFVVNGFNKDFWKYFEGLAPWAFSVVETDKFYFPVVPITVNVTGEAPQATFQGLHRTTDDKQEKVAFITFDLINTPHPILEKKIDLYFVVTGMTSAEQGVDWEFVETGRNAPEEVGICADPELGMVYRIRLNTVPKTDQLASHVSIGVRIFGDRADQPPESKERIELKLIDLDLWTKRANGNWKLYAESSDSNETAGDLDARPHRMENLLFGPAGSEFASLSIRADPVIAQFSADEGFLV